MGGSIELVRTDYKKIVPPVKYQTILNLKHLKS